MNAKIRALGFSVVLAAAAHAQTASSTLASPKIGNVTLGGNSTQAGNSTLTPVITDVDSPQRKAAWQKVSDSVALAYKSSRESAKTAGERKLKRDERADQLVRSSIEAKAFYLLYPNDPQAGEAKKIEILSLLDSARLGRQSSESSAVELGNAYRVDKNQLRENRFEVAAAIERYQLSKKIERELRAKPAEYEKLADGLRKEFGDIPQVHGFYLGAAKEVEMVSSSRIATKVLEMRPSAHFKDEAEKITSRFGLVGRPLPLVLKTVDGEKFETSATQGGVTVLYFWNALQNEKNSPFAAASAAKLKFGSDVKWIYVGMPATAAQVSAMKARAPFPGIHCYDDGGPQSALAQRLHIQSTPIVFVLNRHGVLSGYGRVDELPTLLAKATANSEKK